ncbi:hypothetical protein D3C72_1026610 [compost metagenome]
MSANCYFLNSKKCVWRRRCHANACLCHARQQPNPIPGCVRSRPAARIPHRAVGHAAHPAVGLCAEPGVPHRHFHHCRRAANGFRAVCRVAGRICRAIWPVFRCHPALHGRGHGSVRVAQNRAHRLSTGDCGFGHFGRSAQLPLADAGATADRHWLFARVSGLHHVHLTPFPQ